MLVNRKLIDAGSTMGLDETLRFDLRTKNESCLSCLTLPSSSVCALVFHTGMVSIFSSHSDSAAWIVRKEK